MSLVYGRITVGTQIHLRRHPSSTCSSSSKTSMVIMGNVNDRIRYKNKKKSKRKSIKMVTDYPLKSEGYCSSRSTSNRSDRRTVALTRILAAAAAAVMVLVSTSTIANAASNSRRVLDDETLNNIPQMLSSSSEDECNGELDCNNNKKNHKKGKIQRPKSKKAEACTRSCVTTCVRGGDGEGPLNAFRPLVVFKQGFRSRQYCLVECSDICNLIKESEDEH